MLLAIDVGNTLTNFGIYDGLTLKKSFKTESLASQSEDYYESLIHLYFSSRSLDNRSISQIIISSVVPSLLRIYLSLSERIFSLRPLLVGPGLKSGLPLKVENPPEVGSDIVSAGLGGLRKYGPNLFIADLGTANKYLLIDSSSSFCGLSIAPGLRISLDALVKNTASLPEVSLVAPASPIGKNTPDCMNSGLLYGLAYEISGFAASFSKECGYPLKKVLTGGNASYVKSLLPDFVYDPTLVLDGLSYIAKGYSK